MDNNNQAIATTNGNTTAVQKARRPMTLGDIINSMQGEFAKVLPKYMSPERMVRVCVSQIKRVPDLAKCSTESVLSALMRLAEVGLEPDGRNAHLIPFNNKKTGQMECQLIIDYKGLIQVAFNSGQIKHIHADIVCENDIWIYNKGVVEKHSFGFSDRGKIVAAYAMATFTTGAEKYEVMSIEEIEAIRKRSKTSNFGPWVTDYNEMGKKTVFRRLSKWLPLSPEFKQAAFEIDDDLLADKFTKLVHAMPKASIADLPAVQMVGSEAVHVAMVNGDNLTVDTTTGEILNDSKSKDGFDDLFGNEEDNDYSALEE